MIDFILKLVSLSHEFLELLLKFLSCFICLLLLGVCILISPVKWELTLVMGLIELALLLVKHRDRWLSSLNLLLLRSCHRALLGWHILSLLDLNIRSTNLSSIGVFLLKLHLIHFLNDLLIIWAFKRIAHRIHKLSKCCRKLRYKLGI